MTLNDYQDLASSTADYPLGPAEGCVTKGQMYTALGLNGEAGEVAEKIKKAMRDGWSEPHLQEQLIMELGDVLWYLAMLASESGLDLEAIALLNLAKLQSRKSRGKIHGQGDDR